MSKLEFIDRYQASGMSYPDTRTVCNKCDGMGFLPDVKVCPVCKGTSRRDIVYKYPTRGKI